ncbi:sulfatase-like hydrolase/transferase [Candidatus Peregrinibacteria bacterium]|nr:sulfatase-like hydrolase/transferase [Candidatus Peregrinibacteria bacterium]
MNNLFKKYVKKILSISGILSFSSLIKEKIGNLFFLDKRVSWNGERLNSPVANIHLFRNLEKECFTITYNKESRDCIFLDPNEDVTVDIKLSGKAQIRLSFAYEQKPNLAQGIEVSVDNIKKADLKYVIPHKWHHVAFDIDREEITLNIRNTCFSKIAVAHPLIQYEEIAGNNDVPKNIIVLLLDSLIRDSLGPYNSNVKKYTPNISRFFEKSFKYTNCFTQSEWTFPAVYSLLLSQYSIGHGLSDTRVDFDVIPLDSDDTLAVHMRNLGYTTFAYSTVRVFQPAFNAHIGFDRFFYDLFPQSNQTHREICHKAITQLQQNSRGKNFMFLHFFDTHEPWINIEEIEESMLDNSRNTDPDAEWRYYKRGQKDTKGEPIFDDEGVKVLTERRNARLWNVDLSLQSLFDYLERSGEAQDTMVVICADHGCKFMGWKQPLLCDTRVGTPLLIRHPKIEGGTQKELVESNMDLGPTILKIAGHNDKWGNGEILPPFGTERHKYVISESIYGNLCKIAVRDEKYVYHCTFDYNKKYKKIKLNRMFNQLLFERQKEDLCIDVSEKMPDVLKNMHDFLMSHFKKYPHRLS